ncbi:MAG: amidase [Geobacteraceae bacterium]|nr:amidase [Geobacteraceae bacterium]
MADLGDLLGSLMSGLIRARRMADEQTAALAEYYKTIPLLEGLSVPRIRIPELTIDMPFLIDNDLEGEKGEMEDPAKIATALDAQLGSTLTSHNIKANPIFRKTFAEEVKTRLTLLRQARTPIMEETIARYVHDAFISTLTKTKTSLTDQHKEAISRDLRAKSATVGISKESVPPSIVANIKTADVKEQASTTSVVRLKITLKEEGLEWVTEGSEAGGVKHTLQPE